jgi:hypothetical protein
MRAEPRFLEHITEPVNLEFARLWLSWRGDRLLPRRADIELNALRRMLPLVLLIEYRTPDEAIIRVAGSRLRDFVGYELTGANYIELAPPEDREVRRYRCWTIATRPCGSRLIYDHRLESGRVTQAEVVSLPLDPDQAGGARMTLANIAPLTPRDPVIEGPARPLLEVASTYAFLDIGAGVPDSILPPGASTSGRRPRIKNS